MSRIDRLGGYKNAKEAYQFLNSSRWHRTPEPDIEALGAELLEYRRANNIFEVGDTVVSDFYQLDPVFLISHVCNDDEYIYSNKVFSLGSVFSTSDKLKGECRFLFNEIRHATDEEIAAGYRGAK